MLHVCSLHQNFPAHPRLDGFVWFSRQTRAHEPRAQAAHEPRHVSCHGVDIPRGPNTQRLERPKGILLHTTIHSTEKKETSNRASPSTSRTPRSAIPQTTTNPTTTTTPTPRQNQPEQYTVTAAAGKSETPRRHEPRPNSMPAVRSNQQPPLPANSSSSRKPTKTNQYATTTMHHPHAKRDSGYASTQELNRSTTLPT